MKNPYDFTGKKYIVTGASSGMGRSTAIRLAEQGAQVVLMSRSKDKLNETLSMMNGDRHQVIVVDLADVEDMTSIFNDIVADGKKLDGIVHCAGISKVLPVSMLSRKVMEETMNLNLYSLIEMTRLFSKKKYHVNGSIVAVSSIVVDMPSKCQTIYAASKAALNVAIKTMAMELADKNIRINCVMPASTATPMMELAKAEMSEDLFRRKMETQVLGVTEPEDIANAILFLLSDASKSMTGRALYTDGGYLGI
ncbi:MAG: SDR family oxidoreductase [Eubacteriales bacterium]|nr:SDR family oxidoreductase [Eubacteriales bacterium]